MHDLNITLVQTSLCWENKPVNLDHFSQLLENTGQTDLVILPEMFNTGFSTIPEPFAETMDGPTIQWMRQKSFSMDFAICGSLIIKENGHYFNRLIFMTPGGTIYHYDKRHLFSMAGEDLRFTRGDKRIIIRYKGWNILPLVCYDLRFPVWSKNSWQEGHYEYDLLIYIANWPETRKHAWKSLLTARAIENISCVAAVNRVGTDGNGLPHSGDSVVLDPKGHALLSFPSHQQMVQSLTLPKEALIDFRKRFDVGPDWDNFKF